MAKYIGIDLGTSNSAAAIKRVHVEVLKNSEGETLTPSCVTLKKESGFFKKKSVFEVGKNAYEWLKQDPENTVISIKRLMGRSFTDPEIQKIISENKVQYNIGTHSIGTVNSLAVKLGGKEYTPEEISSQILQKIVTDSKKSIGDTVEYAVITVPAYFNDKQKHATRAAATLAGIKVQRLLPEPTAAAISYGVDNISGDESKTIMVFDFGGGTFDVSVLTISGGQFIEQAKGGDMWLGGDDIDDLIIDFTLKKIAEEYDIADMGQLLEKQPPGGKNRFLGELKACAVKAKIRLSTEEEADIEVLGLLKDEDGNAIDVDVELSRESFNNLILPIVERGIALTQKVLEEMNFSRDLIDNVLLVGGGSLIPLVREKVVEVFGQDKLLLHDEPMLANAQGAAILSHRLASVYECPECSETVRQEDTKCGKCGYDLDKHTAETGVLDIVHSTAHDYFITLENGEKHLLIEKNTPLPIEKKETFKLVHKDQKLVHLKFVNLVNDVEDSIGDLWLGLDIEEEREGNDSDKKEDDILTVELTIKIDENNLIEVAAVLVEYPEISISKTLSRGKADEKLFLSLEKMIEDANERNYSHFVITDLLYRAVSIVKGIHKVVHKDTDVIDEAAYKTSDRDIDKADRLAKGNNLSKPVIFYGEDMLATFDFLIPKEILEGIRKKMGILKESDENGSYEETLRAQESLRSSYDDAGVVNTLLNIRHAEDICLQKDPSQAPKFRGALKAIMENMSKGNKDKVNDLLHEIVPQVRDVLDKDDAVGGRIFKGVARK